MNFLKRGMLISLSTAMVAVLLLLLRASPASAANCLQDEFGSKVTCTANDVKVAAVKNVRNLDGTKLTSCTAGSTISFIADFQILTSSTSSRSNIGIYFGTAGQGNALTGTCADNIIPPSHTCAGTGGTTGNTAITCGSDNPDELDPAPDNCGDTSSSDNSATFGAASQDVTIEVNNLLCQAPAGSTTLVLPDCTSWQVPGKTIQCVAAAPDYAYPFSTTGSAEAIPGSPSKCNCGTINLGITIQSPMATVAKSCNTATSTGTGLTSCTLTPEGGNVTYTVTITNNSNFGNIIVDQICDSAYGNIFTAGTFTGPACPAGSVGTDAGTTCSALSIGSTPGSCTFTATQAESKTVTDTVSVTGHGVSAGTFGPDSSNSVTVTSGEAASTATVSKTLVSTTAGCATVRYGVDVNNSSTADEVLTLSALTDSAYGDITKWTGTGNASVLGTTCGVATGSPGLGSLSGSGGAGTLSTLGVGGSDYTCQFDAQFCGALTMITLPNGSTCNGLQHVNKVTGTLTGDEGAGDVVTQTANTLTVDECFSAFSSSTTP